MTAIPDDELLSAYLDGELTADEGARVERLLAERPESRQLLEELRLVRESLQALPRRQLDDDFSQHVLRQAEREVLHGGTAAEPIAEGAGNGNLLTVGDMSTHDARRDLERSPAAPSTAQGFDWQRMRRPAAWAAMALAAGLLIMFMSPGNNRVGQRQVAHQEAPRGEAARGAADREGLPEDGKASQGDPPEMHAPRGSGPSSDAASGSRQAGATSHASGLTAELRKRSLDENAARDARDSEPSANERGRPRSERFMRREKLEKDAPADGTALLRGDGPRRQFGLAETAPTIDDQTLIVWCEVSPGGDFRRNFDELLAAQQIEWQEADGDKAAEQDVKLSDGAVRAGRESARQRRSALAAKGAAQFDEAAPSAEAAQSAEAARPVGVDARRLAETLELRAEQESESLDRQAPLDALREPATELVLVEATDEQIKAMLAGLDQTPDTYPAVRVEPGASEPEQLSLKQYERGVAQTLGAVRAPREAKQSREKLQASDKAGESAKNEQDDPVRAGAKFKSNLEGASEKEQRSSDHAYRALGRAQRILLQRTPPLPKNAANGEMAGEGGGARKADDAETGSPSTGSAPRGPLAKQPAAGVATSPAPPSPAPTSPPAPSPAPAARGVKPSENTLADESGKGEQQAAGKRPELLGRKLATQNSLEDDAAEGDEDEASAKPAPRVYRVLFVFHPQSADASKPAAATPARPAGPETPDE